MNTLELLTSFSITGVVVSLVVQYTKDKFISLSATKRTLYTLALSVVGGLVIYFFHLVPTNIVETLVGAIGAVNTAYLLFTKYLPTGTSTYDVPMPPAANQ